MPVEQRRKGFHTGEVDPDDFATSVDIERYEGMTDIKN